MTLQTTPPSAGDTHLEYASANLMPAARLAGGDILACAFGMTVAAWIAAYVTRMPLFASPAPGQVTVLLMLSMVLIGGFFAGRYSQRGIWAAVWAGAVSGVLDILVVLSVVHDTSKAGSAAPAAALWVGGSILLNTVVAGIGGAVGALFPSKRRAEIRWTAVFSLVLAAATLPLITAGGLVTAFGVGMAVPDWPTSYNYNMFLFPLSQMQSAHGNFYEHAHRLMGSLVGLTSLTLAIYLMVAVSERRSLRGWLVRLFLVVLATITVLPVLIWIVRHLVKIHRKYPSVVMAWLISTAVGVQGIMGGLRVTEKSIALATVHGIFAQVVFASMACLAAAATGAFAERGAAAPDDQSRPHDAVLPIALVMSLLLQLCLGAMVRQRVESMIIPHITLAAFVAVLAVACGFRAYAMHRSLQPLRRSGIALLWLVGIQLTLGVVALVVRPGVGGTPTNTSALFTTAHQANGALLLATSAVLALWTWRLKRSSPRAAPGIVVPTLASA